MGGKRLRCDAQVRQDHPVVRTAALVVPAAVRFVDVGREPSRIAPDLEGLSSEDHDALARRLDVDWLDEVAIAAVVIIIIDQRFAGRRSVNAVPASGANKRTLCSLVIRFLAVIVATLVAGLPCSVLRAVRCW